ncbi:MAG: thioredoxin-disulfide reductase [Planctomycetes bacterium]|nr:thioredoxin-disulfide reductase [Planctomycetota bacterium]
MPDTQDVVVIGAGPAGMTAGLYAGRDGLSTVVLEGQFPGGQATITDLVDNYPGFPEGISGLELTEKMQSQAEAAGVEIRLDRVVAVEADPEVPAWTVRTDGSSLVTLTVIVASGARPRKLGVPGEERFWGRGISCCATCDGPFFRDKKVVVVGGGDTAVKEAAFLTRFAREIVLIHRRDRLRASKVLQDRLFTTGDKARVLYNTVVAEIRGSDSVEGVLVRDVRSNETREIRCDGIFLFVGLTPNSNFLPASLKKDEEGYIITDDDMATSEPGIFACGDVRRKLLRQIVTACGEGATAAHSALQYVEEIKGVAYPGR